MKFIITKEFCSILIVLDKKEKKKKKNIFPVVPFGPGFKNMYP